MHKFKNALEEAPKVGGAQTGASANGALTCVTRAIVAILVICLLQEPEEQTPWFCGQNLHS